MDEEKDEIKVDGEIIEDAPATEPAPEGDHKDGKRHSAKVRQLEEQVDALLAAQKDQNEVYLRLLAEYENFRRRTAKEKEAIYGDSVADIVKTFLPLMDSLENADKYTAATGDAAAQLEAVGEGLRLILAQLRDCFERLKVGQTGEVGDVFDPNVHFAIMHESSDDPEAQNRITEVFQHGYEVAGKVIRPAMVKVTG